MKIVLFIVALFFLGPPLQAQVYEYKDASGRSVFVDSAEKVPEQFRDQVQEPKSLAPISRAPKSPYAQATSESGAVRSQRSNAQPKVEIFVTSWCPHCKTLEKFLNERRIKYTRYDIERQTMGRAEYQKLGAGGVPLIRIGTTVMRGFNPDQLLSLLQMPRS